MPSRGPVTYAAGASLLGAVSAAGLTAVLVEFAAEGLRRGRITQTYAAEQADSPAELPQEPVHDVKADQPAVRMLERFWNGGENRETERLPQTYCVLVGLDDSIELHCRVAIPLPRLRGRAEPGHVQHPYRPATP